MTKKLPCISQPFFENHKIYEIKVGKFGPYISYNKGKKKIFRPIPGNINYKTITKKQIIELI